MQHKRDTILCRKGRATRMGSQRSIPTAIIKDAGNCVFFCGGATAVTTELDW